MTANRRHPNVVNVDEVGADGIRAVARGDHRFVRRSLGGEAGGRQLGASVYELAPGAKSYPFHWHGANEEAIYVLSGRGVARIGDARVAIRAGDWIALPVGPMHAHQMINEGEAALVYLCLGTEHLCEVIGYPDSNKLNVMAGASWDEADVWARQIVPRGAGVDYWAGELGNDVKSDTNK